MGDTNREAVRSLIQKADLKVADMTTNGGVLLPAQARQFMDVAIQDQVVLKEAFVKPLTAPVQEVDRLGFLSRIARAGTEGQSLPAADRVAPITGKVQLTTVKIKAQCNLTDEDLQDNIEGDTFETHVTQLMSARFGLDLEDLVINGDVLSTDSLLRLLNGLVVQATSNVVDNGVKVLDKSDLFSLVRALPNQFQKNKRKMRIYLASDIELKWRDIMTARTGSLADSAIVSADPIPAYGVPVTAVPMINTVRGGGAGEFPGLFLDPKNICVGIWKDIRIRTQLDIDSGNLKIVADCRADVKYLYEPAVAKVVKLKAA